MKNKFLILMLVSTLLFLGCNDFLDVPPESSIASNSYWKGEDDILAYKFGCYDKFRDLNNTTLLGEDRSDSFVAGSIGPTTSAWAQELDKDHTEDMTDQYNAIYHFNLLLEHAEAAKEDFPDFVANTKAEALLMRAYIYFTMAKTFGDVPLILESYKQGSSEIIGRTPVDQVMAQVKSDIDQAIGLFTSDSYTDKNLWSKPAAYAFKADALLWMKKVLKNDDISWDDIINAANEVEVSGVSLLNDYASVFSTQNKKNNEIIFSLYFDKDEQDNMYGRNLNSRLSNVEAAYNIDKTMASKQTSRSRHVYAPSPELEAIYDKNPNDVREKLNIVYAKESVAETAVTRTEWETGTIAGDSIGINPDGTVQVVTESSVLLGGLPICHKFLGTYFPAEDDVFYDDNLIIYRWADILLLRAEAKAAKGDISGAIVDLNQVRNRAKIGDYDGAADKETLEKEILDERWRELFLELKRWHDLVRAHMYGTIDIYQTVPNLLGKSTPLYWPISDDDLRENELLEQTDGYIH